MKILFIDCCIRDAAVSRTKELCNHFFRELCDAENKSEIKTVDLNSLVLLDLLPLSRADILHRNELIQKKDFNNPFFDYAHEFSSADYIVVGAPFWNLTLPSKLKVYLEWVCMSGITFKYEGSTCIGLCKAKKMLLISTAGFHLNGVNNGADYLSQLSREFLGIPEFNYVCPEGLDISENNVEEIIMSAKQDLTELAKTFIEK